MKPIKHFEAMKLPLGTFRESSMHDLPSEVAIEQTAFPAVRLKEREVVAALLRKNFDEYTKTTHDDGTADYVVTGLLQAQNTTLWMLRRYLP
jgi:DNA-binding ferritin-like protein